MSYISICLFHCEKWHANSNISSLRRKCSHCVGHITALFFMIKEDGIDFFKCYLGPMGGIRLTQKGNSLSLEGQGNF